DSIWAQQYNYGIANETDKAIGIAISNDNKIYITGRSDQDAGIISNDDIVTIKYSSAGIVEWTNRFNGIGNGIDNVKSIKVSSAGNIYVVGKTFSGSDLDIVLIKYNAGGVQQWVKTFNGSFGDDEGIAMTIDSEENIFVVGESFNSDANKDIILLHYSSAGSLLWSQQYDGIENGNDEAKSICLDSNGNIIIAATTSPDTASATLNGDITLLKFSGDGSLIWEETYINELNDDASEAVVDSENNIFITGQTDNGSGGNIDYNYVTLSYSPDGILTDEQVYDGTGHASDVPNTLLVKENGFYVAGGSYGETSQRDIVTILYGTTPQDIHFFDNEKSNITVFPNPVQTNFTLQFPQNDFLTGSAINILITDLSGRQVRSVTSQYNQNILLNRGTIPAGAYLINITAAGSVIAHATIIFN
ncbi:MAG: T9SS type A sorting domain-containing protein, partial [Chitinophagales bacterium]|nr:T9SS type A sorting domain-containing protein [Chitinophagales bacterium]